MHLEARKEPAHFVQRANRKGWAADTTNRNKCRCPACIRKAKEKLLIAPQDSLPLGPVPLGRKVDVAMVERLHRLEQRKDKRNAMVQTIGAKPTLVPASELSVQQRKAARDLLDGHFDADRGEYLDGFTDEKIGAQLEVQWTLIRDYRDKAYGPIKVDPIVSEWHYRLDDIEKQINNETVRSEAAIGELRQIAAKLRAEIITAAAKKSAA
jgi:hypothetical protein